MLKVGKARFVEGDALQRLGIVNRATVSRAVVFVTVALAMGLLLQSCFPSAGVTSTPPTATSTVAAPATATTAPSSTASPSATAIPTATASATSVPSPTATPVNPHMGPNGIDQRFGVIANGGHEAWQLSGLQVDWYVGSASPVSEVPAGKNKVLYIRMQAGDARLTPEAISASAQAHPGAVWYLGGEPNVPAGGQYNRITPGQYITEFRYYRQQIKSADPTALVSGPSILNWDFTCRGLCGYMSGEAWMREFVSSYTAIYGVPPEVDIWAIDSYPLTWDTLPMTEWGIVAEQVEKFREYLVEEVPGHADTPIWIMELASHWAYPKLVIEDWDADYNWDAMEWYMVNLIGWLRNNSDRLGIEKWFFFKAYTDIRKQVNVDSYAGIYFFDGLGPGAQLNQLGRVYRDMATGVR